MASTNVRLAAAGILATETLKRESDAILAWNNFSRGSKCEMEWYQMRQVAMRWPGWAPGGCRPRTCKHTIDRINCRQGGRYGMNHRPAGNWRFTATDRSGSVCHLMVDRCFDRCFGRRVELGERDHQRLQSQVVVIFRELRLLVSQPGHFEFQRVSLDTNLRRE